MKRLLLTGASTAVRRIRGGVLLLALTAGLSAAAASTPTPPPLPAPNGDTDYLFVPGHGLTRRTSGSPGKSLAETIAEAVAINGDPAYRVKISFIEEAYAWKDLQPGSSPSSINITKLAADLAACRAKGLRLRVFLTTQKYGGSFPPWVIVGGHTRQVKSGPSGEVPMVQLNDDATYQLLRTLYTGVIDQLKQLSPDLRDAFYGFVLQEPSLGEKREFTTAEADQWFANLNKLHRDLAAALKDFSPASAQKHRLFWQMINYPEAQTPGIVASMPVGGGLCGPDTFPGEPHPRRGGTMEPGLAKAYDEIRRANRNHTLPTSLHVYALNYNKPYQGGPPLNPKDQPIYSLADSDNDNGLNTPDGIANFLGCVPNPHANSLQVGNVVWSLADGPDNPKTQYPWTGWSRVKAWMKTSQSVPGFPGGCNITTPLPLRNH